MKTIDEMTTREYPELMGTIINIQAMEQKTGIEKTSLKLLMRMTGKELFEMQDQLIPLYNTSLKTTNK